MIVFLGTPSQMQGLVKKPSGLDGMRTLSSSILSPFGGFFNLDFSCSVTFDLELLEEVKYILKCCLL